MHDKHGNKQPSVTGNDSNNEVVQNSTKTVSNNSTHQHQDYKLTTTLVWNIVQINRFNYDRNWNEHLQKSQVHQIVYWGYHCEGFCFYYLSAHSTAEIIWNNKRYLKMSFSLAVNRITHNETSKTWFRICKSRRSVFISFFTWCPKLFGIGVVSLVWPPVLMLVWIHFWAPSLVSHKAFPLQDVYCKFNFNWSLFDFDKDCLPSLCPCSLTHKRFSTCKISPCLIWCHCRLLFVFFKSSGLLQMFMCRCFLPYDWILMCSFTTGEKLSMQFSHWDSLKPHRLID